MIKKMMLVAALTLSTGFSAFADDVKIFNIAEMSGPGAATGTQWTKGLEMAFEEINESNGILGQKIALTTYDTQTDAMTSRALVQKAIDEDAFVLFGTVYSASTIVNMIVAQQAGVPQFTPSTAPGITKMDNPYIFRLAFGAQKITPAIANYMKNTMGITKVGVAWVNTEYGKGGYDTFMAAAKEVGLEIVADVTSEISQGDFASDVVRLKNSGAEATFVFLHEEDAARFMIEYRRQNVQIPILGTDTLSNEKTVELANGAADGILTYVGTTPEAPIEGIEDFTRRFKEKYGIAPTYLALNGYIGAYVVQHVVEEIGEFDRQKVADMLHGLRINVSDEPNVLMDLGWDDAGELYRQGFLVEVVDGKSVVREVLPYN